MEKNADNTWGEFWIKHCVGENVNLSSYEEWRDVRASVRMKQNSVATWSEWVLTLLRRESATSLWSLLIPYEAVAMSPF